MPIANAFDFLERPAKFLVLYPAEILVLLAALALLGGIRVKPAAAWAVGIFAVAAIIVRTALAFPEGFDLMLFWEAGRAVWRGDNPYTDPRILNPPPSLPIYALLATLDFEPLLLVWTLLNLAACCLLGLLALQALKAQDDSPSWRLAPSAAAVLVGVLAFCYACRRGMDAGQLSVLGIMPLFVALLAQGRNRPWLAGAMLAVASIKAATWLPFLLLFLRWRDWPTWVTMAVVGLGLALLATPPRELLPRCRECLGNIASMSQPGKVNDVETDNTQSVDLITLDRVLYCAGVEDRAVIKAVSLTTTVVLGAWLAVQMARGRYSRAAACALIGFYAAIFLYHRQYDMVVLALPLVYVTGRAQNEKSGARWLYGLSGVAILAVLYFRLAELEVVRLRVLDGSASWFTQSVVMPYCIWCVILRFVSLIVAERWARCPGQVKLQHGQAGDLQGGQSN